MRRSPVGAILLIAAAACGRANSGSSSNASEGARPQGSGTLASSGLAATGSPSGESANPTAPRPTILPLPTAPTLPPSVLSPILANTTRQPFPVSPACNGYVFENASADTTAAHVQRGWAPRCKAVLETARKDLAADYPAFAAAKIEIADDDPKDGPRLAGSVMLSLADAPVVGGARGSAIYTVEWLHAQKTLGPYCPYTPERKKNAPKDDLFAVSLKRDYRVGSGLLRLDGFPSDTVSSVALKLEAAMDHCAAIARRSS